MLVFPDPRAIAVTYCLITLTVRRSLSENVVKLYLSNFARNPCWMSWWKCVSPLFLFK